MSRLGNASGVFALLVGIALAGCGPTAEAVTTPTPARSESAPPTAASLPTNVDVPTPPVSTAEPGPVTAPPTNGTATTHPLTTPTPPSGCIWQPLPDFPTDDAFEVTSATALSDGGFVAVGFKPMAGEGFFGRRQGVVWTSVDGRSWQSLVDPAFQFATLEHVVEHGGVTYALGTIETCDLSLSEDCVEPPDSGWAAWRWEGRATWARLPLPASMQNGTIDGAISNGSLLVAFGWTGDEARSVVWTSADGASWGESGNVAEMDPVTAMGTGPLGLVAFGSRFSQDMGDLELLAATSSNGVDFVRVHAPALPATTIQAVASGASGIVAVGDGDDLDLNFSGITLHSADGSAWTQTTAADGSFAGAAIRSVHAVPTGYVALGIVPLPDEFGIARGVSWFSADGLAWQTLAPLGDRFSQLLASAAGVPGIVAFTVTEEEPDDETVISTVAAWFAPMEVLAR